MFHSKIECLRFCKKLYIHIVNCINTGREGLTWQVICDVWVWQCSIRGSGHHSNHSICTGLGTQESVSHHMQKINSNLDIITCTLELLHDFKTIKIFHKISSKSEETNSWFTLFQGISWSNDF